MAPPGRPKRPSGWLPEQLLQRKKNILAAVDAEKAVMKVYYCFLTDDQIRGKTLIKLGIPSLFGGKIDWAKIGTDFPILKPRAAADRALSSAAAVRVPRVALEALKHRAPARLRLKAPSDRPRVGDVAEVPRRAAPVSQAGRKEEEAAAVPARPKRRILRVVSGDDLQQASVVAPTSAATQPRHEAGRGVKVAPVAPTREFDAYEPFSSPEDINKASNKPWSLGVFAPKKDRDAAVALSARASRAALAAKGEELTRQLLQRRAPAPRQSAQASSEETEKDVRAAFATGKRKRSPVESLAESPAAADKYSHHSSPLSVPASPRPGRLGTQEQPRCGELNKTVLMADAPSLASPASDRGSVFSAPTQKLASPAPPASPCCPSSASKLKRLASKPADRARRAGYPALSLNQKTPKRAKAASPPPSLDDSDDQSIRSAATFVLKSPTDLSPHMPMSRARRPLSSQPQAAPDSRRPQQRSDSSASDSVIPSTQLIVPSLRVKLSSKEQSSDSAVIQSSQRRLLSQTVVPPSLPRESPNEQSSDSAVIQSSQRRLVSQTVVPPSPPRQESDEQSSDFVIEPSQRRLLSSRSSRNQTSEELSSDSAVMQSSQRRLLSQTVVPPSPPRQESDEQSSDFLIEPSQRLLMASRSLQQALADELGTGAAEDRKLPTSPVGKSPIIASGGRKRRNASSDLPSSFADSSGQRSSLTPGGSRRAVRQLFKEAGPAKEGSPLLFQPAEPVPSEDDDEDVKTIYADNPDTEGDSDKDQPGGADSRSTGSHLLPFTRSVRAASKYSAGDPSVGGERACGRPEQYVSLCAAVEEASRRQAHQPAVSRSHSSLVSRRSSRSASPRRRVEAARKAGPSDSDCEDTKAAREAAIIKRREQREARGASRRSSVDDASRSASRAASVEAAGPTKKRNEQVDAAIPLRSVTGRHAMVVVPPYPSPCGSGPSPDDVRRSVSLHQVHGFEREQKPPGAVPPSIRPCYTSTDSSGQARSSPDGCPLRRPKSSKVSVGIMVLEGFVQPAASNEGRADAQVRAGPRRRSSTASPMTATSEPKGRRGRPRQRASVGLSSASPKTSTSELRSSSVSLASGSMCTQMLDVTNAQAADKTPRGARRRSTSAASTPRPRGTTGTRAKRSPTPAKLSVVDQENRSPATPKGSRRHKAKASASMERIVTSRQRSEDRDISSGLSDVSIDSYGYGLILGDPDQGDFGDKALPTARMPATSRPRATPRRGDGQDLARKAVSSPAPRFARPIAPPASHTGSSQSTTVGQDLSSITLPTISSGSSRTRLSVGIDKVVRVGATPIPAHPRASAVARRDSSTRPREISVASPKSAYLSPLSSDEAETTIRTSLSNLYSPVL